MKILITGANGFLAKNLRVHLSERQDLKVVLFSREDDVESLESKLVDVDFVFHLAGVNRPKTESEFTEGNADLTRELCRMLEKTGKDVPVLYTSSIQAALDNPYGKSKLEAEQAIKSYAEKSGASAYIFRLPNVFGKWSKPNYNSVVATFCNNIANDLPIQINDPSHLVRLVYVDDVVKRFISIVDGAIEETTFCEVSPVYEITVGDLADKIQAYKSSRENLVTEPVGTGLDRALHSTYLSYLKPEQFSYPLIKHGDERGVFVEMLKTKDSGQFSFFTAHPGITRGGHYHHSKTEKFLVLKGKALFKFRDVLTDEYYELETNGDDPVVVETVPGWTHDITNIGDDEMIVMLWANEIFDRENPDTYAKPL
ncbi:capsular polysaccharide biosynthesis protein CapF [Thiomicrorhabdus sp.]|uniref:UDP-2-acetamido-2,6-beta-L-arabino-hexul-4-ose reductase n=1 Tax=Thiomicrorhabdus sp. TaxID=2039724 RepID=UPI00356185CC